MDEAARHGLSGRIDGVPIAELAARAVARSVEALRAGAPCAGAGDAVEALERLSRTKVLPQVAR
jgi:hypothetical protein